MTHSFKFTSIAFPEIMLDKLEGVPESAYFHQVNCYRIVISKGSYPDCRWKYACQI